MGRVRLAVLAVLLLSACGSIGQANRPTPAPVATSYVAPLVTVAPTAAASAVPTPQPEEKTPASTIITVEPASSTTAQP